jgi:hypothetical protein
MIFAPGQLAVLRGTKHNTGIFVRLRRYLGDGEDAGVVLLKHVVKGPYGKVPVIKNIARMRLWEVEAVDETRSIFCIKYDLDGGVQEFRYMIGPMAENFMKPIDVDMRERRGNDTLREGRPLQ